MKPENQHIELMKFMGWRQISCGARAGMWRYSSREKTILLSDYSLPPLTLDLLHEAVKKMTKVQRHEYAMHLSMQFWPMGWSDWQSTLEVSEATIEQRLGPILKAVGLWREE